MFQPMPQSCDAQYDQRTDCEVALAAVAPTDMLLRRIANSILQDDRAHHSLFLLKPFDNPPGWGMVAGLKVDGKRNFTFRSNYNITIILFPIRCSTTLKIILTTSYHISIKIIPKSLISELSRAIASVYYTRYGLLCDVIFAKQYVGSQLAYKHSDQLTDKMSDSDESFDIFRDIKPYSHLCRQHSIPVHNKSWIGMYLFVLV